MAAGGVLGRQVTKTDMHSLDDADGDRHNRNMTIVSATVTGGAIDTVNPGSGTEATAINVNQDNDFI